MPGGTGVNHLHTIIGIVVGVICVILATPIVRIIAIVAGVISGVAGWANWLPEDLAYYVIRLPTDLLVSAGTGFLAMIVTAWLVRRADVSIVAYVVGAIYLCIFLGAMAVIYSHGQTPNELLSSTAQLIGIVLGLAMGREHVLQEQS